MKFTQNQKAQFLGTAIKGVAAIGFAALLGLLAYNIATSEKKGRERALQYEKEKGKKKRYQFRYKANLFCHKNCNLST